MNAAERSFLIRVPLLLFGLYLAIRPFFSFLITWTGDETRVWYFCRRALLDLTLEPVHHNTMRFGMTIPTTTIQYIFGNEFYIYYIVTLSFALCAVIFLYNIISHYVSREISIIILFVFMMTPSFFFASVGLFPEIFSMAYLALALWFLKKYIASEGLRFFILSGVFLFFSYTAKITNGYFILGVLLGVFLTLPFRRGALLIGILGLGYAIEHLAIAAQFDEPLGRLGIITRIHGQTMEHLPIVGLQEHHGQQSIWDIVRELFQSKVLDYPIFYRLWLLACIPLSIVSVLQKEKFIKIVGLALGFFLVIHIFGVKSINPLIPFEPAANRYIFAALFISLIPISYLIGKGIDFLGIGTNSFRYRLVLITMIFSGLMVIFYVSHRFYDRIGYLEDYVYMRQIRDTLPLELESGSWVYVPHNDWEYNKIYRWFYTFFLDDHHFVSDDVVLNDESVTKMGEEDTERISVAGIVHNGKVFLLDPRARSIRPVSSE
jgi:hypothetical protein